MTRTGAELLPGRGVETDLWLLRHAEVHEDWRGKAYGALDVPLSADGETRTEELARAAARLGPGLVLTSPLARARRLGECLSSLSGAPLEVADELREIDRGAWQGRTVAELFEEEGAAVRAFYDDPWTWRDHGGECDAMVADRAAPPVRAALERNPGGVVAVASHYNVVRVLVTTFLELDPKSSFGLRLDPGNAVHLRLGDDGFWLRGTNLSLAETGARR